VNYNQSLGDLRDILQRADLLKNWSLGQAYSIENGTRTRVDFAARVGIRSDAHAKPAGVEFTDADIELTLEFEEEAELSSVHSCSAQVVVDGLNDKGEIVRFAMHFDRHDPDDVSTDLHAQYHWQVGGDQLEGQQFGTVLQLQGPRFPWHPIDPVLLVDFVLGHFHGGKRSELMQQAGFTRYPRILRASQTQLVAPFFTALHNALNADPFVPTPYWPSLCGDES
jgi:hypothetical protein